MNKTRNYYPPGNVRIQSVLRTHLYSARGYLMIGLQIYRRVSIRIKLGLLLVFISFLPQAVGMCWISKNAT